MRERSTGGFGAGELQPAVISRISKPTRTAAELVIFRWQGFGDISEISSHSQVRGFSLSPLVQIVILTVFICCGEQGLTYTVVQFGIDRKEITIKRTVILPAFNMEASINLKGEF